MTEHARSLLAQAMKLPENERESLAFELLESIGAGADKGQLSEEWRAEIDRRIERIESGSAGPGLDWRSAMDEIRREVESERGPKQ